MHPTAMSNCQSFFDTYSEAFAATPDVKVIEIGSQDVNGNLRGTAPSRFSYVGVDFVEGRGVDVVLQDPYKLPFEDASADIILSSSCFEHSEMFWLVYLEIMRVLKPRGLFYLNVPSNGDVHRYPVDCWRFYPDSGRALATWGRRNGLTNTLLESYVSTQQGDRWNDFVGVFLKDDSFAAEFPKRILHTKQDVMNGVLSGQDDFVKASPMTEDQRKLAIVGQISAGKIAVV